MFTDQPQNVVPYRNVATTATKAEVKATPGNIYGLKFINPNTTAVYVKIYNAPAAGVTVGTTAPQHVVPVPAGDGTTPGITWLPMAEVPIFTFEGGITIAAVLELADAGTTAPATAINAEIIFK